MSGQWGDRSKSQESGVVAMMMNLGRYKNGDTSEAYDISALKSLEPGGRITIMSDSLKYTVSKADIICNRKFTIQKCYL